MVLIGKSIKFTGKQIEAVEKIAKEEDRSFNYIVRKAVDEFIKNREE